jgi:hypothetical protein
MLILFKELSRLLELLISHGTMFFSHNKTVSAGFSAAETISRTRQLTYKIKGILFQYLH